MTPGEERWAEALAIDRMYGADAPSWIAVRIVALEKVGDYAGVARMQLLAEYVARLQSGGEQ